MRFGIAAQGYVKGSGTGAGNTAVGVKKVSRASPEHADELVAALYRVYTSHTRARDAARLAADQGMTASAPSGWRHLLPISNVCRKSRSSRAEPQSELVDVTLSECFTTRLTCATKGRALKWSGGRKCQGGEVFSAVVHVRASRGAGGVCSNATDSYLTAIWATGGAAVGRAACFDVAGSTGRRRGGGLETPYEKTNYR